MQSDRPIVPSRLAMDWYYVTQGFFVWKLWRDIRVRYVFTNRNFPAIKLAERIDLGRLKEEIQHVSSLSYTKGEIDWLRNNFHESRTDGFLTDAYLNWLRTTPLSDVNVHTVSTEHGPKLQVVVDGRWGPGLPLETHILPIITQLNAEAVLAKARVSMKEARKEGRRRHMEKLKFLKKFQGVRWGSFGLRRQLCFGHSYDIDELTIQHAPNQFTGISNVYHAMKLDYPVTGTFAHQLPMVYVAKARAMGLTNLQVRASVMSFCDDWSETFTSKWLTAVPDTFGSKAFFDDFGPERAKLWPSYKQDSGNPFERAEYYAQRLREYGVDPKTKCLVPTDGLTDRRIAALTLETSPIWCSTVCGWGTHNSNDVGHHTFGSFVIKPDLVTLQNGCFAHAVKLSDNIQKATGNSAEVARIQNIFGHQSTYSHVQTV
jgi:nicotinate phosphoribosyltransferase